MKILLLEDDEILNEVISSFLLNKGYEVSSVYDGEEAEVELYKNSFDLLLLDVNVPAISGFELLAELRKNNIKTPAIYITSLNETEDLKKGFLSGCDDYIKKPFEFDELELRIENIKRLYKIQTKNIEVISTNISYDYSNSTIFTKDSKFKLSKTEIKVFEYFLKNKPRTISLNELASNVWSYEDRPYDSTIRTYIKNFRKILGEHAITTIKGIGYRFN